jgi:hypothetical protein
MANGPSIDGQPIKRAEIYYRDFNVLSYMPYADEQLIRTHDAALKIEGDDELKQAIGALPEECDPIRGEPAKENLYALFRFYGADNASPLLVYRVSRFSYTNSANDAVCRLDDSQRQTIQRVLAKMKTTRNS